MISRVSYFQGLRKSNSTLSSHFQTKICVIIPNLADQESGIKCCQVLDYVDILDGNDRYWCGIGEHFLGAPPILFHLVEGIAAGLMLTMVAETVLSETYSKAV
ncbi:MAG: hypothetical protein GY941_12690 [Planctomycetes bacterium]|nr:hypothetical protein [Planctomycetota bacterium]